MATGTASVTGSAPDLVLTALAQSHDEPVSVVHESSQQSVHRIWLDKLLPAYLFGLIAASKGWTLSAGLSRLISGDVDVRLMLWADYQAMSMIFFVMIAALYLTRRQPVRRVQGPV